MSTDIKVIEKTISEITIGTRYRQDMGDLHGLAASIHEHGLLQPIGITEDNVLVWGERRLKAAELLGWIEIPARVVQINSIIEGEYAENEMRKDFTKSERVAIAEALEREMGERRGNPNLKKGNDLSIVVPEPQLSLGEKTRDLAANRVGWGSGRTYEQAKKVVTQGVDELKTAMDMDKISIKDAAVVAEQPEQEQRRIISLPKRERRVAVDDLKGIKRGSANLDPPSAAAKKAPPPRLYSNALQQATLAITSLEVIVETDPHKIEAIQEVRDWCNSYLNKKGVK
jgi:ParB family chromosome partitioning protein